jgi:DNA-binding response OmpR family regulator
MSQKKTVLVIDDEEYVADALGIILSDSGYDVTIALSGADGLDKCDRQGFDITITDLRLPDMPGIEVISRVRQKQPGSVIILITSYGTPAIVSQALSLGARAYLPKPFQPSDLLDLIDQLLHRREH